MHRAVFPFGLLLVAAAPGRAPGEPPQAPPAPPFNVEMLTSPEVRPDRRVTFRLHAPKVREVRVLGGDFPKPRHDLRKGKEGAWSVTIGPLGPGIYAYRFFVDDTPTIDPRNGWVKPGATPLSLVEVRGEQAMPWEARGVPNGAVHVHWCASGPLGGRRRVHVYTPPGYAAGRDKYPVLYLLHGTGDDDSCWTVAGRANFILDSLLAGGKVAPMLVVMPENNFFPGTGGGRSSAISSRR